MNKTLGIITARSGSKRLPQKNILKLHHKPLIAWTIEPAIQSSFIDDVIISTDDESIASIAQEYGAEVPFIRPESLSNDTAKSIDVIGHALDNLSAQDRHYEKVILLQPTSPLRSKKHIDEAFELYSSKNAKAVVSVSEVSHPEEWTGLIKNDLLMNNFCKIGMGSTQSQDFKERYIINGAIYIFDVDYFLAHNTMIFFDKTYAYIMDRMSSIDIDNYLDFKLAEIIMADQAM